MKRRLALPATAKAPLCGQLVAFLSSAVASVYDGQNSLWRVQAEGPGTSFRGSHVMARTVDRLLVAVSLSLSLLVAPTGCEQPHAALAFFTPGSAVFSTAYGAQARFQWSRTSSRCLYERRRPPPMRCAVEDPDGYAGEYDQQGGLSEQAALGAGTGYPIPALGRIVIADLELNVPRRAGKRSLGAEGLLGSDEPQIQAWQPLDSFNPGKQRGMVARKTKQWAACFSTHVCDCLSMCRAQ